MGERLPPQRSRIKPIRALWDYGGTHCPLARNPLSRTVEFPCPALMDSTPDPQRLDHIRAHISARLRRLPAPVDEQFAELVDDIADVTLKYEEQPRRSPPVTNE